MKLLKCHIDNFGGLQNYDYDFDEGLNILLHDNGWGKTTLAAFLKAMLYGLDKKKTKSIVESERKRYLPWQGGTYGGSLDFEAGGKTYRIERTFGETPRSDKVNIVDLDTNRKAKLNSENLGEELFHLDSNAFQRSVFINQNGLTMDHSSASSIHTRLNALVSQTNDLEVFDEAIDNLTKQIKVYEKTGNRGKLGDIAKKIEEKENLQEKLESDISKQDSARERIREIDRLLNSLEKEMEEKKQYIDKISGDTKKKEASQKLLDDINLKISSLQEKIDIIKTELGGNIPQSDEIDQVKTQKNIIDSQTNSLKELEETDKVLSEEYAKLTAKYGKDLPDTEQLDQIQSIYGKLQGVQSANDAETEQMEEEPEGYRVIGSIVEDNKNFIEELKSAIDTEEKLQKLFRQLNETESEIRHEGENWKDKQSRYKDIKKEMDELQPEIEENQKFAEESVKPAIAILEDIQSKEQILKIRNEELTSDRLTEEEESLLKRFSIHVPDSEEGSAILQQYRKIEKLNSDIQGLAARLDGENARIDSLNHTLGQLNNTLNNPEKKVEKPVKTTGMGMLGAGAVFAALGLVLMIALDNPIAIAVLLAGLAVAVAGIVNINRYKAKSQAYKQYLESEKLQNDAFQKKMDAESQLHHAKNICDSLLKQKEEVENQRKENQKAVSDWVSAWNTDGAEITENLINQIIDSAKKVKLIQDKKNLIDKKTTDVSDISANISEQRVKIDSDYPDIVSKDTSEALEFLRNEAANYKIKTEKLESAKDKIEKFLSDYSIDKDSVMAAESPKAFDLKFERNKIKEEFDDIIHTDNEILSVIEQLVDKDNFSEILDKAEKWLNEYQQYADKIREKEGRQQKRQQQIEELKQKIKEKCKILCSQYEDREIPERLTLVRADINHALSIKDKISAKESDRKKLSKQLNHAHDIFDGFIKKYGKFSADGDDIFSVIIKKARTAQELSGNIKQLIEQRESINKESNLNNESVNNKETAAKNELKLLEERRDQLRTEYTQTIDFIRQADTSLEQYPDLVREIRQLYDEKQKAQSELITLKKTIQFITQAKENLANRYLGKVEQLFNNYMHIWLNNDVVRGILDIDFNITIEENNKVHMAEGYSTGYCDLIDFCMRLALVDTLFENEPPFLILDDPFVNLDTDHLEKALELLNVMAANKQIVYFVCHPIRAVEKEEDSVSRQEFVSLAEAARKMIADRRANHATTEGKKYTKKLPRERYKVVNQNHVIVPKPVKPDYIITNNIFRMSFTIDGPAPDEISYEFFFIDEIGHVLNERQIIEVKNGKMSTDRIHFSLNSREDSGEQYELMIRESGQEDYEVLDRLPFKAKLVFASDFDF